jgi:hypothetical protein
MSKGIPALTYLPEIQAVVISGNLFSSRSLKAGLNEVAEMQEGKSPVGTYLGTKCLMDNPYSTCTWDIVITDPLATATVSPRAAVAGNTVTINGLIYTGVAGAKANNTQFSIDTGNFETAIDIGASINADTRTGDNGSVNATVTAGVVTLTTTVKGSLGNTVTLASSGSTILISGPTFTGALDSFNYQLTFNSEDISQITANGRPALTSRRLLDIAITANNFPFTVRSAQAVINLVEKFEDRVSITGTGTTGDGVFANLIAQGPTPYKQFIWDITKADAVYTLTSTVNS